MPMLAIKDLNVRYGDFVAVDNLSCEVKQGEIVGLIGPNGAGKSSLLAAIAGTVKAHSGSISLDRRRLTSAITDNRSARRLWAINASSSGPRRWKSAWRVPTSSFDAGGC